MSIQTFSKSFLFPNNKRKLKTKSSYSYWAGPWEPSGPRPHLARSDRAKGRGGLARGFGPRPLGPARPRRRSHAGVEMPRRRGRCQRAGGRCRLGQGKRASARGLQGGGECEQATRKGGGGEEGCIPRRPSTAAPWLTAAKREEGSTLAQRHHNREHQVP